MNPIRRQTATPLFLACALVLSAGCQSTIPPKATYDRVTQELDAASQANAALAEAKPDVTAALLPPLITGQTETTRKAVEPRFDLAVNAAPAGQVFMAIVSGTRYSMILHPEVAGEITVNLKNVTVTEALDTLRDLYGYEYKLEGTRISILPNTLQTRLFQVNYLAAHRQGSTDVRVTSGSIVSNGGSTGTGTNQTGANSQAQQSSQLTTAYDNNFWEDLRSALGTVVGSEGGRSVIVNPMSGVIVVRAFPAEMRNVERYLEATQLVIERQVMLEAKIIEVRLSDGFQSGINWSAIGTGLGKSPFAVSSNLGGAGFPTSAATNPFLTNSTGGGLINQAANSTMVSLSFQTDNFASMLKLLESQGDIQVLSSPRIATLNNQKAVLKVGNDEFYVTNVTTTTTTSATGNVSTPTLTLQPFFSGIALDVTPQIDEDNNVILHVHPSISAVSEKQKIIDLGATLGSFTLPLASSNINESDSIVRVSDGNIVAIGGLFTQETSSNNAGIPGLVGKPVVGDLLGQRARSQAKRELVILIKPTIIKGNASWQGGLDEVRKRLSTYGTSAGPSAEGKPAQP